MAADPRKRQKKLERRSSKRKAKHHDIARAKSAGLPQRLADAAGSPVLSSFATEALWDEGIGWVCLSRQVSVGEVAFALFLVDRYCLGVKNAMSAVTSRYDFDTRIVRKLHSEYKSRDLSPATVRKFVEGAVEYARNLGLSPHPDYERARLLFGTIDPAESKDELEFGKDGKPYFFAGPFDTPARCRHVLKLLEQHCGPSGFHFTMPVGESSSIMSAGDLYEDAEEDSVH